MIKPPKSQTKQRKGSRLTKIGSKRSTESSKNHEHAGNQNWKSISYRKSNLRGWHWGDPLHPFLGRFLTNKGPNVILQWLTKVLHASLWAWISAFTGPIFKIKRLIDSLASFLEICGVVTWKYYKSGLQGEELQKVTFHHSEWAIQKIWKYLRRETFLIWAYYNLNLENR